MSKINEKMTLDAPGADEVVDVEAYTKADKKPPIGKKYRVKIGDEPFVFDHHLVTGKELLEKAGKTPVECYSLYLKLKGCDFEKVTLSETVDLSKPGIEQFVVKPPEVFHYLVDDEPETTDEKFLTANQILENAGLKLLDYYLVQVFADGSQKSYKDIPNQRIEMKCPGEKFISVFRGETPVS
jgi:hypothetical protein